MIWLIFHFSETLLFHTWLENRYKIVKTFDTKNKYTEQG